MMNNSGQSLQKIKRFYKIDESRIVIFYDDLDLASGKIRVRLGGSAAGHNGIKSIQSHLGTDKFWRVRLGIGHPGHKGAVHNYVLSDFSKAEKEWVEPLLSSIAQHCPMLLEDNNERFMTKIAMDAPAPQNKEESN